MTHLGSDVDPRRYDVEMEEEEEPQPEPPQPEPVTKKSAEGDKLANTMSEEVVEDTVVEEELAMDSYVATLRNGYLGIGSGVASPIEMEIQTEEEIDIVKP